MQNNPYNVTFGNGKFGDMGKPLVDATLGEWVDFGKKVLVPATRNNIGRNDNLGSSAMGRWQMTASTTEDIAPKVLGADWRNIKATPETQDSLARYLFEQRKGGNLKGTWESLPNPEPGAYKDYTFEQIKPILDWGETRTVNGNVPVMPNSPETTQVAVPQAPEQLQPQAPELLAQMKQEYQAQLDGLAGKAVRDEQMYSARVADLMKQFAESDNDDVVMPQIKIPQIQVANVQVPDIRKAKKPTRLNFS